jgi:hypothetical protein
MNFGVFMGHVDDQNQCKLYKQHDISNLTRQVCGPGAKSCS